MVVVVAAALVFLASQLLFDLPMRGNWITLTAALSLYLLGALATGLLVSTIADTQQVAFQIALLVSLLPTLMLSGFIFPIGGMPVFFQWLTYLVPAKYAVDIVRGIVLRGATATDLWQPIGLLSLYTVGIIGLAVLRFKKTAA